MNHHTKACLDPVADVWGIEEAEGGGGESGVPGGVAAAGAYKRLRLLAQRAAETSWAGDNAANIQGEMKSGHSTPLVAALSLPKGGDGEPYLADMVVVPAALIRAGEEFSPRITRCGLRPQPNARCQMPDARSGEELQPRISRMARMRKRRDRGFKPKTSPIRVI